MAAQMLYARTWIRLADFFRLSLLARSNYD